MASHLVRDLVIAEARKTEIKSTLAYTNQLYAQWCALSDEEINNTRERSPLHMI